MQFMVSWVHMVGCLVLQLFFTTRLGAEAAEPPTWLTGSGGSQTPKELRGLASAAHPELDVVPVAAAPAVLDVVPASAALAPPGKEPNFGSANAYPYPERIIAPPSKCKSHVDCGESGVEYCGWPLEHTWTDPQGREANLRRSIEPDSDTGMIMESRCLPCATCVEENPRRHFVPLGKALAPVDGRCPKCPTTPPSDVAPKAPSGEPKTEGKNQPTAEERLRRFRSALRTFGRAHTGLDYNDANHNEKWFKERVRPITDFPKRPDFPKPPAKGELKIPLFR